MVMLLLAVPGSASAATLVDALSRSCYAGGSTINFSWQIDPGASHGYSSIWQGASQPTWLNGQATNLPGGGHFDDSPTVWTAPNTTTTSAYKLYIESHSSSHSNVSTGFSTEFNIDASGPSLPVLFNGSVDHASVDLSWTSSNDAGCEPLRGYRVYRNGSLVATVTGNSYQDGNLSPSTEYSYTIRAYDNFVTTGDSNTVTVATDSAPVISPSKPATLQASAPAPGQAATVSPVVIGAPKFDFPESTGGNSANSAPPTLKPEVTVATEHKPKTNPIIFWGGVSAAILFVGTGLVILIQNFSSVF